jgi:hypothetical protein
VGDGAAGGEGVGDKGVVILLIMSVWTIKQEPWIGLASAVVVLCIELQSIHHIFGTGGTQQQGIRSALCFAAYLCAKHGTRKL